MRIVAIIPARGGSKGIPKKNIRLLAGKPLIAYSIQNAINCDLITDVFVSTDSVEIAEVAKEYGADIIKRSKELSDDFTTLDPVVYDAVIKAEEKRGYRYDYVITMQPTSPLLKEQTLEEAINDTIANSIDSMISVVNDPHLSWRDGIEDNFIPNYSKRLNRQQLPPYYVETGAFVITRRNTITQASRFEGTIGVFPVSKEESIDIDDTNDWVLSEALLGKKRIVFRVDGYAKLGMGHIYNCITLAYSMIEHEVLLVLQKDSKEGIKKVQESNLPYRIIDQEEDIDEIVDSFCPDIWVNDRLNTSEEYIKKLKEIVPRVVTIEDLGPGTRYADAVINALYSEEDLKGDNVFSGWKYACLRDEFLVERTKPFSDIVKNVMIMFGGTDPSNYNRMLYDIILNISDRFPGVRFNFIVGIGYDVEKNHLKTIEDKNVFVFPKVQRVSKYMKEADLAISSQGRAIFELAAMGVPSIILSQNEREKKHSFAGLRNGFINLGTEEEVDSTLIENTLSWLINTSVIRKNMYDLLRECQLRDGLERVKNIILGEKMYF